jgi:hypothetical protein
MVVRMRYKHIYQLTLFPCAHSRDYEIRNDHNVTLWSMHLLSYMGYCEQFPYPLIGRMALFTRKYTSQQMVSWGDIYIPGKWEQVSEELF